MFSQRYNCHVMSTNVELYPEFYSYGENAQMFKHKYLVLILYYYCSNHIIQKKMFCSIN